MNTSTAASPERCMHAYSMIKILIVSTLSVMIFSYCATSRPKELLISHYEEMEFQIVTLKDLILNKGQYHGKLVETVGYYSSGFERSKLVLDSNRNSWTRVEDVVPYNVSVWLDFHPAYEFKALDSLNHRYIKVRGIFDTSIHGHLDAYYAGFRNVFKANTVLPQGRR